MFKSTKVFGGFSVDDLEKAKAFYRGVLGLDIHDEGDMGFGLQFADGGQHFIYPKPDHEPATFTVLNFVVDDIDAAMTTLKQEGVVFERYDNFPEKQDEAGVLRGLRADMGPDIAWFKDPADNILSVLQEK